MNVFQKLFPSFDSLLAASADADHRERERKVVVTPAGISAPKRIMTRINTDYHKRTRPDIIAWKSKIIRRVSS